MSLTVFFFCDYCLFEKIFFEKSSKLRVCVRPVLSVLNKLSNTGLGGSVPRCTGQCPSTGNA